ncbi:EAL domain-containing protein [Duganella fentianensis]|uniref:bifunctional diguanylate cyclase/phosphodiesterase n=1 Tax=Duganella fentianensis TaxID=2692177 RepID=UPI0032B2722B
MPELRNNQRSPGYLKFRRRLLTGLFLMAILAIAVVISQFRTSYNEREHAVRSQTEHYAKAMEAHVLYSIQSVDLSLLSFSSAIKVLTRQQSRSSTTMSELLSSHNANFSGDYAIIFLDNQGNSIASSDGSKLLNMQYRDKDFFKAHLDSNLRGHLYIGEPELTTAKKIPMLFLSRRVENDHGEFLGVIVAPVNIERFVTVFENSRFDADIVIALIHGKGKVIVRVPNFIATFGHNLAPSQLFEYLKRSSTGTYHDVSAIDGLKRVYSYRALDEMPLIIVVGSNDAEANRILQQNYLIAGAGLTALLLLMIGAGHFSLRTYQRQEEKEQRYRALYVASSEMEKKLRANEESMRLAALLFQNSSEAMMVTDVEGKILTVNPAFSLLYGYLEKDLIDHRGYELAAGQQEQSVFDRMSESILEHGEWEGEIWQQHKDGETFLVSMRVNTVFDEEGNPIRHVALLRDITKKKASEELIWRQANFDALTSLSNRRMFHEHLRLEMKKTDRSKLPMALVFLDVDHFKQVNDTLGHDQGDLLLKQVAQRLTSCVRGTDIVSRLGGDEFTIILSELRNASDVARIAQEILRQMSTPFELNEHTAHVSSSIGITLYPEDGKDAETLIKNADQAMYIAKQEGRNRFHYFAPYMQEATRVRMELISELRETVARNELRLLFQPIVDLQTGKICKAEALVRWEHPERGLLNPAEFISIAESSGMIVEIGDWVFRQAAQEVQRLRQSGHKNFQIGVNKSAWQFRENGSNYQNWLDYLRELEVPTENIIIEVTENLLLDSTYQVAQRLAAFQQAHMQISLDDFGTGYCSVAFLKRFNVDYIKLDRSLITDLSHDRPGHALWEAIIVMAHKLDIKVIAEGIETLEQLAILKQAGCDLGQGYLFSRPISGAELEQKLKNG